MKAYEHIIGSASRSNPEFNASVARGAKFMRGGGAVLGMAGLAFTAYDIWQAPEGQRLEVAKRDAVGFAGGLIGAEVFGGLLAVGAGLLLATPPGWVVIAVGLVGGIVGSILTDRVFYPKDYRSAAAAMRDGFVLNPRHPPRGYVSSGGLGSTTLPVVKQITLTVQPGDTPVMLKRRANLQAAASVGLLPAEQAEFANRYDGLKLDWMAGDPTPLDGNVLNQRDIASMVGQRVVIQTTVSQRSELEALAGR